MAPPRRRFRTTHRTRSADGAIQARGAARRTTTLYRRPAPDAERSAGTTGNAASQASVEDEDPFLDDVSAVSETRSDVKGLIEQRSYESLRSAAKERLLRLREAPSEEEEGAAR